jgi:hypothetical protein
MKKMLTALLAAAVAGALFIAAPLGAAPKGTEHFNKATERDSEQDCGEGNTLAISAPTKLWPPNHKYFDEDLYVVARDAGDGEISLTTTGTHNQYDEDGTEMNGAGNTSEDITVIDEDAQLTEDSTDTQPVAEEVGNSEVRTDWAARAERSGRDQAGRIYTLSGTAVFEDGSCSWSYNFAVPHDMRPSNREDDVEQG